MIVVSVMSAKSLILVRRAGISSCTYMKREVTIAKDEDLDLGLLADHPLVVKHWKLPHKCNLFELYHPVFEQVHHSDPEVVKATRDTEPYKSQAWEVELERRKLLAPLWRLFESRDVQIPYMHYQFSQTVHYWFKGVNGRR
jgi:hypothetical protein